MRYTLLFLVLLTLLLSACTASPAAVPTALVVTRTVESNIPSATEMPMATATQQPPAEPTLSQTANQPAENLPSGQDLTRTDGQGAVEVAVTPNNLPNSGETLDFEVDLNTHSVNLNMDLAKLSTLKTDTGLSVSASSWNGENGGHHVAGILAFPNRLNGKNILEGTKVLTLVIQNVDAPERTFRWDLKP